MFSLALFLSAIILLRSIKIIFWSYYLGFAKDGKNGETKIGKHWEKSGKSK